MFEISDRAAAQLKLALAEQPDAELALRLSVRKAPSDELDYRLGFDDSFDTDTEVAINGIKVVVDDDTKKLVEGMVIDFAEFEGQEQIVFLNPNDTQQDSKSETDAAEK